MSQRELARRMWGDVNRRRTLIAWERGDNEPSPASLDLLAHALGVPRARFPDPIRPVRNGVLSEQVGEVAGRLDRFGERLGRVEAAQQEIAALVQAVLDALGQRPELPQEREVQ